MSTCASFLNKNMQICRASGTPKGSTGTMRNSIVFIKDFKEAYILLFMNTIELCIVPVHPCGSVGRSLGPRSVDRSAVGRWIGRRSANALESVLGHMVCLLICMFRQPAMETKNANRTIKADCELMA